MNTDILRKIYSIIERDSASTTYKFALLRGTIEVIQENSPFITKTKGYYELPFYFLIEKWIVYYYHLYAQEEHFPQINGNAKLAFENEMIQLINVYKRDGGVSRLLKDIRQGTIPFRNYNLVSDLFRKIRATINTMPMQHIGFSVYGKTYCVFPKNRLRPFKPKTFLMDEFIIGLGSFRLANEYFTAFNDFGYLLTGNSSIISRWSDFSVNASRRTVGKAKIMASLTNSIEVLRNTEDVRKIILEKNLNKCVWSGKKWELGKLEIDHIIPFSLYQNNDLWNLVPATKTQNQAKLDRIPSVKKFLASKDRIIECWKEYETVSKERFHNEMMISLTGNHNQNNWEKQAYEALLERSQYLINSRKLQIWN